MRRIALALTALLLAASCSLGLLDHQDDDLEKAGTFEGIDLVASGAVTNANDWYALIMTDTHVGRATKDYPDNFAWFQTWYNDNRSASDGIPISFLIHLGDLTDGSYESQYLEARRQYLGDLSDTYAYFIGASGSGRTVPFFFTPGNHDVRKSGRDHFLTYFGPGEWKLVVGDVSLYGLDSGRRYFGGTQIDKLEDALKKDSNKKLFFSHIPLSDQNLVYTYLTLTDEEERARMIHDMVVYGASAYIDGHRHLLVGPYHITDDLQEISLSCLNGPDMLTEKAPVWYILHYDGSAAQATITQYRISSKDKCLDPSTKRVMTIRF